MLRDKLYEVLYKDENKAIVKLSNKDHPLFKAHFPTMPILPGYIHFEIVADLFDININTIKKAKFLKTISPEQTVVYEKNTNKYRVYSKDEEVANFTLWVYV